MPSILKYFMKPKAEDYELPNEEQLISQLEEMIRLKESIPGDGTETVHHEEPDEPVQPVQAEEQREKRAEPTRSFEQEMSLAQAEADRLIQNAKAQAEHIIEQAKQIGRAHV